jgi:hypothetical protein
LSGIEKELGPKGFAVVEAAVNDNADVPGFIRTYQPPFPVGTAGGREALEYMQWPLGQRPLVPLMAFIDRNGMIRAQYTGVDTNFFDDQQDKHIRAEVEKLLQEGAAGRGNSTRVSSKTAGAKR